MSNVNLRTINHWMQMSCARWNENRLLRRYYRMKYRGIAKREFNSAAHQMLIQRYREDHRVNTYLWPYCDEAVATWDETLDSLITDPSNCVIKYATSYCAYKIFETTGKWPRKKTKARLDAKKWVQFLNEAGYTEVMSGPEEMEARHYYVGVKPEHGEWGLVVWIEALEKRRTVAEVSTYDDKKYVYMEVDPREYTWVKIL